MVTYLGKNNFKHTYLEMNLELAQPGDLSLIHDRPQNCSMCSRRKNSEEKKIWASLGKALRTRQRALLATILNVPHALLVSASQEGPDRDGSSKWQLSGWNLMRRDKQGWDYSVWREGG